MTMSVGGALDFFYSLAQLFVRFVVLESGQEKSERMFASVAVTR